MFWLVLNSLKIATKFESKLSKASRKLDFKLGSSLLRNNWKQKNCYFIIRMKPSTFFDGFVFSPIMVFLLFHEL